MRRHEQSAPKRPQDYDPENDPGDDVGDGAAAMRAGVHERASALASENGSEAKLSVTG